MAGNQFGQIFKITSFGESHGSAVGCVLDGCPPGLELSEEDIQLELDRRRPGQGRLTTERNEGDRIQIHSGVFEGRTTGAPIAMWVHNSDARPADYKELKDCYRPSHADFTYDLKYGHRDWRGGGRSSARETLARVAAGAIAKKFLRELHGVEFLAFVDSVADVVAHVDYEQVSMQNIEQNLVRCPNVETAKLMAKRIQEAKESGDSLGGVITGLIRCLPSGLGEPVFDKFPALLAQAMMSINAAKAFEFGSGFAAARMLGSEHNDPFTLDDKGHPAPASNKSGGCLGGITTGQDVYFRVAFKPVATITQKQQSVSRPTKDKASEMLSLEARGRHDPCVLPRAVPIVEAMSALVAMDLWLLHKAQYL